MNPFSKKVLKELKKAGAANVISLDAVRRGRQRIEEAVDAIPPELSTAEQGWMRHFLALSELGVSLLGLWTLRKLADRIDRFEETYMPGGPPMSPVLDSFFAHWWLADAPVGATREPLAATVADVAHAYRAPRVLVEAARTMAQSFRGFYVVKGRTSDGLIQLEDLLSGTPHLLSVTDAYRVVPGEVWWTRLLPGEDGIWTALGAPYVFTDPQAAETWRAYFKRTLKKSSREAYIALLKRGTTPEFWFEYVLDAYAGADDLVVFLEGVPDDPSSLPHARPEDTRGDLLEDPNPMVRARAQLSAWVTARGGLDDAREEFAQARALAGAEDMDPLPSEAVMVHAFAMYGALDPQGQTALDAALVAPSLALDPDARRALESVRAGWFSLFEIDHIRLSEALEVKDRLRRRNLTLLERAATEQVSLGDLLCGWITAEPDGTHRLEGAALHVPRWGAERFVEAMRACAQEVRQRWPRLSSAQRSGLLVPIANALLTRMWAEGPQFEVFDSATGEAMAQHVAHYRIVDPEGLRAALERAPTFEHREVGRWAFQPTAGPHVELTLDGERAELTALVPSALEEAKSLLAGLGPDLLVLRIDTLEDLQAAASKEVRDPSPPLDVPPEVVTELMQATLTQHMTQWVDEKIPALGDKTPRAAVRSPRGRERVEVLLRDQERAFERMPHVGAFNLDFVRTELGLETP